MADGPTPKKPRDSKVSLKVDPYDIQVQPFEDNLNVEDDKGFIVEGALLKGRRHFGVAGASLTWMTSPSLRSKVPEGWDPSVVDIAQAGEQRTTRTLLKWIQDKPGAVLIDSCHIPGHGEETVDQETGLVEGGDTDHVLIVGDNILVIDTKVWKKRATYKIDNNGKVIRNNKSFGGGNVHISEACHMWFNYIDNRDSYLDLKGCVYIDNDDEYDKKKDEWLTKVYRNGNWYKGIWKLLEEARFLDWLDEWYNSLAGWDENTQTYTDRDAVTFINSSYIAQVAVTCVRPYNPIEMNASKTALNGLMGRKVK